MLYLNSRPLTNLSVEMEKILLAAEGYFFLDMPEEALRELDAAGSAAQNDLAILRVRVRAHLHLKRWRQAEELSRQGSQLYPEENEFMVQRAFALHQLKKGGQAIQVLLSAPEWIRQTGILHYNLACYEAQLGDISTAHQCIRTAIKLNASFKKNARVDPDLQRLWN